MGWRELLLDAASLLAVPDNDDVNLSVKKKRLEELCPSGLSVIDALEFSRFREVS